jgi:hypothetical protein
MMHEVTHENAMAFLDLLKERMPEWSYDNYEPEIEYIQEMLWQYNDLRNS